MLLPGLRSALLGSLGAALGGEAAEDVIMLSLMREIVVLLLFELNELVHGAEHITLLVVEEPLEGLISELHMLLHAYLHVLPFVQFAKVANHILSKQLPFKHGAIFVPDDIVLL